MSFWRSSAGLIRTACCNPIYSSACSGRRPSGRNMLPLFYTNPIAAWIFGAACLIWMVPETIGMVQQWSRVSRKSAVGQDRGSFFVLLGLQWMGLALNFVLAPWAPG